MTICRCGHGVAFHTPRCLCGCSGYEPPTGSLGRHIDDSIAVRQAGMAESVRVLADWADVLAGIVFEDRGRVLAVVDGMEAASTARTAAGVEPGPLACDARDRIAALGEENER